MTQERIYSYFGERAKLRHDIFQTDITFAAIILKPMIKVAIDFSRYHELAEQNRGKIPLKQKCEREGMRYRDYQLWCDSMGISPRIRRRQNCGA